MNIFKYISVLSLALIMGSCMDKDWEDPNTNGGYGNNDIEETNVVKIKDLKTLYASTITSNPDSYVQFTEPTQIKGRVTANDIEGNIYSMITIDDGTGAIILSVSQGGLFAIFPEGQEVLVDLKDLWIGGYRKNPQIGVPYTNSRGSSYISRMNRFLFEQHVKLIGEPGEKVLPVEFDKNSMANEAYLQENSGKLMTIKNVEFKGADGKLTFAPESEKDPANSVNRELVGIDSRKLVVRTSTYADFAAKPLPSGKVDITGIFTRYNGIWQVLPRTYSDIKPAQQ